MKRQNVMNKATKINVATVGIIGGFISIEHGFFEILQGNVPINGIKIDAIGSVWRFEGGVGEMALTIVPNFLITGIIASMIGIFTIIWSIFYSSKKYGYLGLLCLSILSLFLGGGIAYFFISLLNSIVATRINSKLHLWVKIIPKKVIILLETKWVVLLILFAFLFIITLACAIFGLTFLGVQDVTRIATNLGYITLFLYLISVLACFSFDIQNFKSVNIE